MITTTNNDTTHVTVTNNNNKMNKSVTSEREADPERSREHPCTTWFRDACSACYVCLQPNMADPQNNTANTTHNKLKSRRHGFSATITISLPEEMIRRKEVEV